jgi:dihydropteroate synthase
MPDRNLPEWGKRTYVMGILNVTPDSFSGDGLMTESDLVNAALRQAHAFEEDGADILDIGGESTRPGSSYVSPEEEHKRVLPVIEALRKETGLIISVDTYKAEIATASLDAGADWINDVWAFQADPKMAVVVADRGCPVILMHNRSKPSEYMLREDLGGMYQGAEYADVVGEVKSDLLQRVGAALQAGVRQEQIILDPGIGFGKSVAHNLELINRLDTLKEAGYPVLLGPSRKSFIGYTLNLPPGERLEGTLAAACVGIIRGADIIRVHDVKQAVRTARMTDALVRAA